MVIAIGIVSFAFISIIGLIPWGLSNMKGSVQTTVMSMIAQKMINDAAQTDFDVLASNASAGSSLGLSLSSVTSTISTNFFDDQGNQLTNPLNSIYWAKLDVTPSTTMPGAPANTNLALVTITVAYNPSGTTITNWTTPPPGITVSRFVTEVANNTATTNN